MWAVVNFNFDHASDVREELSFNPHVDHVLRIADHEFDSEPAPRRS